MQHGEAPKLAAPNVQRYLLWAKSQTPESGVYSAPVAGAWIFMTSGAASLTRAPGFRFSLCRTTERSRS